MVFGNHALKQADSVLTYMGQFQLKGKNLSRSQTSEALQSFPGKWKLHFTTIKAPPEFQPSPECSIWRPDWWDEERFGHFNNLTLVRCKIPSSFKCALKSNFHTVVIAFGDVHSSRLDLQPPCSRIYF